MARLVQPGSGLQQILGVRHLVGRAGKCDMKLRDRRVSGEHGLFKWGDGRWILRDLGSRNGTWVDGERLPSGQAVALQAGVRVGFGDANSFWCLVCAGPPQAYAIHQRTGTVMSAERNLLALNGTDGCPIAVWYGMEGGWISERAGEQQAITNGSIIEAADGPWTVLLPPVSDADILTTATTRDGSTCLVDEIGLVVSVSRDEEFVKVELVAGEVVTELDSRAYHYLLLLLVRATLAEKGRLSEAEEGWLYTNELAKMLKSTPQKINVDIHRIRRQFAEAGVEDAGSIVERRPTTAQLRIGIRSDRLKLVSLE